MTIDTHVHLYDTQRPQGVPFPKPEDRLIYRPMLPADLRQVAEPAGVRGAVLVEASPSIEDNDWVLDLVANEPFICGVVGNLDPEAAEFPRCWNDSRATLGSGGFGFVKDAHWRSSIPSCEGIYRRWPRCDARWKSSCAAPTWSDWPTWRLKCRDCASCSIIWRS